jgi:membrane protein DedA with SNARE-associated domain
VVVLAAGSFTTDGDPDPLTLFAIILAAAVLGDVGSYSIGRWAGHIVVGRFGSRVGLTPERVTAAERRFERWGGVAVLVTRFLLTGLAVPINLVAGGSAYPVARFVAYAALGEAIWTGEMLALGWLFGSNWVALLEYLDDVAMLLTTLTVAVGLMVVLVLLLRPAAPAARAGETPARDRR